MIYRAVAVLSMVNIRTLVPPRGMELGAKLLENPSFVASTLRLAVAPAVVPALDMRSPEVFR